MNSRIFIDSRWVGNHGIGRVAKSLMVRLNFAELSIVGSPVSPFDNLFFLLATLFLPRKSIVFSPGFNAPLFFVRPFVFIVHDLNHVDIIENSSMFKRIYYFLILKRACHSAIKILTVSEFSKKRIVEWSGVDPKKVINIKNGVDEIFSFEGEVFSPGYRYLLSVSNRKSHKNEFNLLRAFKLSNIDPAIKLIFTGIKTNAIEDFINDLELRDRVVFLGMVPENDLPKLYRGAIALVFPSLYEGFGLPVIESMACGTPVLTSNISALPEVSAGAALLIDPESVDEIASGIRSLVNNSSLHSTLRTLGLLRAKEFNWDAVAERVQSIFSEIDEEFTK